MHETRSKALVSLPPGPLQQRYPVLPRDLLDQVFAVLTFAHLVDQRLNAGDVADDVGEFGAIEIGTEADMVFAEPFDEVIEVAHDWIPAAIG